jgi:hypothetical protein
MNPHLYFLFALFCGFALLVHVASIWGNKGHGSVHPQRSQLKNYTLIYMDSSLCFPYLLGGWFFVSGAQKNRQRLWSHFFSKKPSKNGIWHN